jgi:hypothetical protein
MAPSKENMIRVAHILISDSRYEVDHAAVRGFMYGCGFESILPFETWLKEQLGDEYPRSLPAGWLYAEGL